MYKASVFLFLVVLFSCSSVQTIGQVIANGSQSSIQANAEAQRLLQEGIELTGAGQLPQAVRALEEAIKLDPHYADAYSALGRAYFKMHQWQSAVENLRRAVALNAKQRQAENAPQQQLATQDLPPDPNVIAARMQQEQEIATSTDPTLVSLVLPVPATIEPPPQPTPPEVTQSEKPATAEVTPVKSDVASEAEEKQEPIGVNVSMGAPPPLPSEIENNAVSPIPLKPTSEDVSLTKIYRVGPGDVLDVRTNAAPPGESTLFTVTPAGLLEHPLLAEPLNVSTLTTEEIQTKIQEELKKRALSENPEVTVGVRDYASHTVLVSGLVKDSGTKILRREAIPLYVVVADAQPLPEAARVTVVRNEQSQMFEIDLTDVTEMSLLVRPGDVINLQPNETQFIYVGGEVKAPGEKTFRRGLTLTQAIISAGGVTEKSKVAEIARDDGQGFLVKTSFKLKDIQTGKAMDPFIRPGDRIMVLR
jgi:protein involved in polysaccharide export with SLBB domain